ncbi:hypothetical protein ACHQM5_011624 [Ranunculus cassubicifolius]
MIHARALNFVPPSPSQLEQPPCKFSTSIITFSLYKHSFKTLIRSSPSSRRNEAKACSSCREGEKVQKKPVSEWLDDELLSRISSVKDADKALVVIAEKSKKIEGIVSNADCGLIIKAAFDRNNTRLALSIYSSMKARFHQGVSGTNYFAKRWKWGKPDVHIYSLLVRGLASSLQVSDAARIVHDVSHSGVYSGEEVAFGNVVQCPRCKIALAIVQPEHGIQIAACSKCRYQYQLFSGKIVCIQTNVTIETEEKCKDGPSRRSWISGAVHSIVVQPPIGVAETHKFSTSTVKLTAREGDRVTVILAAPSNVNHKGEPLCLYTKAPGFKLGEAMCLTNHTNGLKPVTNSSVHNFLWFIAMVVFAPITLPINLLVAIAHRNKADFFFALSNPFSPPLKRLPQKMVEVAATKQQLLSQYDLLQNRINGLREATQKEVWMLARMCQLENKMEAVGQPSYRARRGRIKKVRKSLERSLIKRIELIHSYAKISSIIEIEIEMGYDAVAGEPESNVEDIAEQIEQIMELENLEEKWKSQAEANDEVEMLLSSQPMVT